uniref:KIAA0825 n=1 Tax=Latimeria chalumnae TaxID=7897 RepID=H3B7S1_LATCH
MEWKVEHYLDHSDSDCLLDSLPTDLDIEQTLSDIDEKLKRNTLCIEQTLKDLQLEVNETCIGETLQNTSDCLHWLNNFNFTSPKPLSTPHVQLIDFLKALQHFLKTEQAQEEVVLELLLDLSSQCGVSFPCTPSGTSFQFASRTSLHAVEENSSMDVHTLWDDVRLHLRRFLVDGLQSPQEFSSPPSKIQFRTYCLQRLLFLYPEPEVLIKYQNIQMKSIQDLLQASMLSCCGEANFDQVVLGYQSVTPILCTMIKEDLYTLSRITEPFSVLKFINETYLDKFAEELSILMERLCDLQLKENVLHANKTSKISSKQKGSVHALGTHENAKKGRSYFLTSYQLKCLSQLIKLLLYLEDKIEELSAEILLLPSKTELSRNIQGVLKKNYEDLETIPAETDKTNSQAMHLLQVTEPLSLKFSWRSAFKELSPSTAHCIKVVIEDVCAKSLQHEQDQHNSSVGSTIPLVSIQQKERFVASFEEEQPKRITKFCSDIMEELDALLPLALACRDDFLQKMRANFVEACCKVAAAVLARLEERSKEVPSKAPVQNLYAALSTAIYVLQCLILYENLTKETNKKPLFLLPIQRYQEFISALQFQVTDYCVRVCATSILQDAESHHWDDSKAFYEGERCSFSIQMWHYYSCALRHDLWNVLPPRLAQEILAKVLSESCTVLVGRYSQAQPSYKRTPQISRTDITALLLCVENLLWSMCSSVRALLQPTKDNDPCIFKIHSHCNSLLAVLAILTSPLKNLYETFKNGFCNFLTVDPSEASRGQLLQWLYWIKRANHFYPALERAPSAEVVVQGYLKLLLAQPCCNWNLLLQTLLHHDCLILKILLSYSREIKRPERRLNKQPSLIEAVFMVLTYCSLSPKSLGGVLESYLDKHKLWDDLYNISVCNKLDCSEPEPEILRCLRSALAKPIRNMVKQIISLLYAWQAAENHGAHQYKQIVPESLLKKIPKEWKYPPRELKRKESGKSFTRLVVQAVSAVVGNLPTAIASLPTPIKYFFNLAEKKASQQLAEQNCTGLLLWNFLMMMCKTFEDGNAIELLTSITLDRWGKEKLSLVSECLLNIVGQQKGSPKPVTQMVLQTMERQRPKWIESQLQKARRLSTECAFVAEESKGLQQEKGSTLELTEQKIAMMVLDICHKPGGSEYLRQIYHIIQLNEQNLNEHISFLSGSDRGLGISRLLAVTVQNVEEEPKMFNPLQVFNHYGDGLFDQSAITEWNWDWTNLLPSYLGLSETTFRALLANR